MISHTGKAWGLLFCFVFLPVVASAQLTGLERQLDLAMSPAYPAPGDSIKLSLKSYSIDLDRSSVVWYVNNKEIARGPSLVETTITAGALGTANEIVVVAEEEGGLVGSARATIRPAEVDLLWHADSYAPPYFHGRTFAGTNAQIHAAALVRFVRPNGTELAENEIVYSWQRNGARVASGRGKSSVTIPGPMLFGNDELTVYAESVDGTYRGEASVRVVGVDPAVELYENHPLFGILFHRALVGNVTTLEREQKVTAIPYFASARTPQDNSLVYEWKVGNLKLAPDPEHPETVTITTNGYSGPVGIDVMLTSARDFFLKATGTWELIFSESGSIFDLSNDPFAPRR